MKSITKWLTIVCVTTGFLVGGFGDIERVVDAESIDMVSRLYNNIVEDTPRQTAPFEMLAELDGTWPSS